MAKGAYWNPQEDDQLRRLVENGSTDEQIAVIMGRTLEAIQKRRSILGLVSGRRARWSSKDVEALRRAYEAGYSIRQMAEMLNRPTAAVEAKLYQLTDYSRAVHRDSAAGFDSEKAPKFAQHSSDGSLILSLQARLEAIEKYLAKGCLKRVKGFKPNDRL